MKKEGPPSARCGARLLGRDHRLDSDPPVHTSNVGGRRTPLRSLPDSCKGRQVDDTCCLLGNNSHHQVEAFSEKRLTTRVSKYRLSPFSCMGLCKQQLKKRAQAAREGAFFGQARPDAGPSCTLDAPSSPHLFLKVAKSFFLDYQSKHSILISKF